MVCEYLNQKNTFIIKISIHVCWQRGCENILDHLAFVSEAAAGRRVLSILRSVHTSSQQLIEPIIQANVPIKSINSYIRKKRDVL